MSTKRECVVFFRVDADAYQAHLTTVSIQGMDVYQYYEVSPWTSSSVLLMCVIPNQTGEL